MRKFLSVLVRRLMIYPDLSFTLTAFPSSADGQAFIYSPLKCTLPDGWVLPETLAKEGRFSATLLSRFFKKLLSIRKP